ncbi:MAG TPA: MFS transporter [Chthoniobacteraceae bacterium]|jgi:MFS family permease
MSGIPDPSTEPPPILPHDAYLAFRSRAYRFYSVGNFISVIGRQMLGVALSYEVFRRTQSATALGLIGLAGALPIVFLALPAGQIADRFNRRRIIILTQALGALTSIGLMLVSIWADSIPAWPALKWSASGLAWLAARFHESGARVHFGPETPLMFGLLLLNGIARTFGWAARSPFMANLVPRNALANAVTWGSSLFEIGSIAGPALGGFVIALSGFPAVYGLDAVCSVAFIAFLLPIQAKQEAFTPEGHPVRELFSGLRFVVRTKVILATITLDLFAVLLGGATALLPMYADQILHVGPLGLGWLRGAQSIGAVAMAVSIAHLPPMRRAGWTMLIAVSGFGAATIIFGLSKWFWLSFLALAAAGAFDNISVVVRHTLVQILTPDAMRGRVAAVNNIFIGSSNELGAFESGITAALWGPIISVVAGGIGTIFVVIATALRWPEVRTIGALAVPEEKTPDAPDPRED